MIGAVYDAGSGGHMTRRVNNRFTAGDSVLGYWVLFLYPNMSTEGHLCLLLLLRTRRGWQLQVLLDLWGALCPRHISVLSTSKVA